MDELEKRIAKIEQSFIISRNKQKSAEQVSTSINQTFQIVNLYLENLESPTSVNLVKQPSRILEELLLESLHQLINPQTLSMCPKRTFRTLNFLF